MTAPIRVVPDTTTVHLEFKAGESVDILLDVSDQEAAAVPLSAATATMRKPYGEVVHTWSMTAGNLVLDPEPGRVRLVCSAADTRAWAAWGDAEWQLDVTSTAGVKQRPCEGDVRIDPTREEAAA